MVQGSRFRVQGSGFRVQGMVQVPGFRVQDAGSCLTAVTTRDVRMQGSGFRVQGSGFRVHASGCCIVAISNRKLLQAVARHTDGLYNQASPCFLKPK